MHVYVCIATVAARHAGVAVDKDVWFSRYACANVEFLLKHARMHGVMLIHRCTYLSIYVFETV